MAHLDYSHWASAGASIGLYSAAMEAILAAANDKAPSAEERNETERPAPTSALEELPDDVRRFLLLPNRSTGEAAQPFKSILANLYAASRLKSIEEQREILRACGELLAIVRSLLLPVVLGLIPERPIDDKSGATVHRAWTDSVSASDIRHALAWALILNLFVSLLASWTCCWFLTVCGGLGRASQVVPSLPPPFFSLALTLSLPF
eukprot:Tamp_05415.p1 GENE.Tamp_05415~~Tamp_05415.p1  ORF type:complete len:227 (-),score=7.12 Tamp_05415:2298-2915(-)